MKSTMFAAMLMACAGSATAQAEENWPDYPAGFRALQPGEVTLLDHAPDDSRRWIVFELSPAPGSVALVSVSRSSAGGNMAVAFGTSAGTTSQERAGLDGIYMQAPAPDDGETRICVAPRDEDLLLAEFYSTDNAVGEWSVSYTSVAPGDPRCGAALLS
ncbi:hypothetical protein [Pelagovum pacificum]|uniref:DOMON domain-containing protein n=1 Tax=Pelagovum pacificum TaxID=2588711 RepID=A0A5C5G820_9RHOB|nr:hypothetical protein [Pelagovum pacificum]QQA41585.1 hypothetical protein I8N54_12220 [Pelagovum pacificum]TNY30864.1 hypothetical protein FHY64_17295 [Pelagovum pacificum]